MMFLYAMIAFVTNLAAPIGMVMKNDPEDGVQGAATLWKLTQAITAHARDLSPERSRELHELSGHLLSRVKLPA